MNTARPTSSKLRSIQTCLTYIQGRTLATPTSQTANGVHHQFIKKGGSSGSQSPSPVSLPALNTVAHNRLSAERLRLMPFNRNVNTPDYYELLGIRADAKARDIKAAYYALAKQFHPDSKLKGDSAARRKFVELNTAYEVLSDATKRAAYNKLALAKQKHGLMGRNAERIDTFQPAAKETTGGGGSSTSCDQLIELPFLEAIAGTERTVIVSRTSPCGTCRTSTGTGHKVHQSVLCPLCKGSGRNVKLAAGNVSCKMCLGARYTVKSVCQECSDRGTVVTDEVVPVTVPAGSANNDVLTVDNPQTGRPMRVRVRIADSDQFRRQGFDVYTTVTVPFTLAILGGPLAVAGVYGGEVHTKLPAGTQPDTQIRLVGKGIRKDAQSGPQHTAAGGSGDHILVVNVRMPQQLSERQRALLTSFATMESATPQADSGAASAAASSAAASAPTIVPANAQQLAKRKNWSRIARKISSSAASLLNGA